MKGSVHRRLLPFKQFENVTKLMKALKMILAILACLFVIFHLIEIPRKMGAVSGEYAASWWGGKLAAILIGTAIAIALFRSATRKPN